MHNDSTVLFKQRLKTTQLQMDTRKAFLKEIKRTFWAPQPNCEERLNDEDRKLLEIMKTTVVEKVECRHWIEKILAKNKEKLNEVCRNKKGFTKKNKER